MAKKPTAKPSVTDHALVRYLERVMGFDLDRVRREILTPDRVAAIEAGVKEIKNGKITFKIRDLTIITVIKGD